MTKPPFGNLKTHAIDAYQQGVPYLLPSTNRYKNMVVDHSYGDHEVEMGGAWTGCPICEMGCSNG